MRALVLGLMVVASCFADAMACSYPRPPDFSDAVRTAEKIFIARVLDQQLTDRTAERRPVIEGGIEIVETLMGDDIRFETVEFLNTPCGGLRLDTNHHYVIFTSQTGTVLRLVPADNSVVSIEAEYIPWFKEQNDQRRFLKSVISFVEGAISAEEIDPFPNIERNGTIRQIDCRLCAP